jgi:protoheme IX farnesyltransferase
MSSTIQIMRAGAFTGLPQLFTVFIKLTKAGLVALVLASTAVGFVLGSGNVVDWLRLGVTLVGTGLTACGANALNEWMERERDGRMERTRHRPLPAGRVSRQGALLAAAAMVLSGPVLLLFSINVITAGIAVAAATIYTLVYTPLKARRPVCTLFGALCGAMPPMMGWSAATGGLEFGAWLLGIVLFIWQVPHFFALAWLYREDYARGGFQVLPVVDESGQVTCQVVVLYCLALVPAALGLTLAGLAGWFYAAGSFVLGALLVLLGTDLYRRRTEACARRLFLAGIIYLPLLLGLLIADRGPAGTVLSAWQIAGSA